MSVLPRLATSLGRRDEVPNVELAEEIASSRNQNAIKELVENLKNQDKNIQADCIKALYEVGERKPELIGQYAKDFIELLDSKNNRMVWGAMTAIDAVTSANPKAVFGALSKIIATADAGTVITKDHAVGILSKLSAIKEYNNDCFHLLNEQILHSPVNQLPTYAEKTAAVISAQNKPTLLKTLQTRFKDEIPDTKRKRLEKVMKRLG